MEKILTNTEDLVGKVIKSVDISYQEINIETEDGCSLSIDASIRYEGACGYYDAVGVDLEIWNPKEK